LKIGKALGIGTGTVQRVLMEQPRPFDVDVAEAALPVSETETRGFGRAKLARRNDKCSQAWTGGLPPML
jgi:hypothetical protein